LSKFQSAKGLADLLSWTNNFKKGEALTAAGRGMFPGEQRGTLSGQLFRLPHRLPAGNQPP
jgi:hypothetical protein